MGKIVRDITVPFMAPKQPFRDPTISLEAKGLLAILYSLENDGSGHVLKEHNIDNDLYHKLMQEFLKTRIIEKEYFYNDDGVLDLRYILGWETPEQRERREQWEAERAKRVEEHKNKEKKDWSFVYILESNELYKIGVTKSLKARVKQAKTFSAYPVKLVCFYKAIDSSNAYEKESLLHEKFANKRMNGEWFFLDKNDLSWILADIEMERP